MNWGKAVRVTLMVLGAIVLLWVVAAFVLLHGTGTTVNEHDSPIVTITTK